MRIKEMAKKTKVATSSEEDDKSDTGIMGDCSIRVVTPNINFVSCCITA